MKSKVLASGASCSHLTTRLNCWKKLMASGRSEFVRDVN